MHGADSFLLITTALIGTSFILVAVSARLGIPPLVGYLLAGILIGPSGLALVIEGETLNLIGEIGVILLLFALGLEFSLDKLISLKRLIFGLGAAQVLVTSVIIAVGLVFLTGIAPPSAVLIAGAVAMSSTALCFKVLAGAGALGTSHGRIVIGVLLFQDLAAVCFLVFHDAMAVPGDTAQHGVRYLVTLGGVGLLAAALFIARSPLQRLAKWVTDHADAELAQLLALTVALLAAVFAVHAGLSPALGAFAAGMMIAEGDARHVVEREIRPFRDLFIGVFFIGIGTQIRIDALPVMWPDVLAWLGILFFLKFGIALPLVRAFGEPVETSRRAAAILAHGGEFGLLVISLSMASGLVGAELGDPLLLALGLSMLAGAVVVRRMA